MNDVSISYRKEGFCFMGPQWPFMLTLGSSQHGFTNEGLLLLRREISKALRQDKNPTVKKKAR